MPESAPPTPEPGEEPESEEPEAEKDAPRPRKRPRIPEPDPRAAEAGKRFMAGAGRRALLIGAPVSYYTELAHTVQSEGVTLTWEVRDQEPRLLDPDRARRQYNRLSAPPQTRDRPLTVNGVLYRVITESTREGYRGS